MRALPCSEAQGGIVEVCLQFRHRAADSPVSKKLIALCSGSCSATMASDRAASRAGRASRRRRQRGIKVHRIRITFRLHGISLTSPQKELSPDAYSGEEWCCMQTRYTAAKKTDEAGVSTFRNQSPSKGVQLHWRSKFLDLFDLCLVVAVSVFCMIWVFLDYRLIFRSFGCLGCLCVLDVCIFMFVCICQMGFAFVDFWNLPWFFLDSWFLETLEFQVLLQENGNVKKHETTPKGGNHEIGHTSGQTVRRAPGSRLYSCQPEASNRNSTMARSTLRRLRCTPLRLFPTKVWPRAEGIMNFCQHHGRWSKKDEKFSA